MFCVFSSRPQGWSTVSDCGISSTYLHFGTSVHNKTMCHVYDLDLYVKVMVTGQDHICYWSVEHTCTLHILLSIFISLPAGVQHNQWMCREYKLNMYLQWQGHNRLMSTRKFVGKIRFQSVIFLSVIISQCTNLCHTVSSIAR